jgi:hypothetical protein
MAEKTRYSDEELEEFRQIINDKLALARRELSIMMGQLNNSEWNGHKHDPLPTTDNWLYLVQYTAGSEGWNCTDTNQMIFYSVNHAYKKMEQAEGRIDRMNTPFTDLYYTYLTSDSLVDKSILDAVQKKKRFNETMFVRNKYHFIPIKKKRIHES